LHWATNEIQLRTDELLVMVGGGGGGGGIDCLFNANGVPRTTIHTAKLTQPKLATLSRSLTQRRKKIKHSLPTMTNNNIRISRFFIRRHVG
jgi:hypothetical protein